MSWKTVASFVPVSLPRQCGKRKPSLLWYRYSGNEMLHSRCCFGPTAHCMQVNCKHPHFITLQPSQTLAKIPWVMDRGRCQRTVFQMIHSRDWNDQEAWGLRELSLFHGQGVQHWSLGSGRLSRVHKHRESFQFEVLYKESLVQTKRQVKLRKASQPWLPDCVCHRLLSASLPQSKEPPGPNPGIQDRLNFLCKAGTTHGQKFWSIASKSWLEYCGPKISVSTQMMPGCGPKSICFQCSSNLMCFQSFQINR